MTFEFNDYGMTHATACKILSQMSEAEKQGTKFKSAIKRYQSGARRVRYCLVLDGLKIRNAKEWKAYKTPAGFTAGKVDQLRQMLAAAGQ